MQIKFLQTVVVAACVFSSLACFAMNQIHKNFPGGAFDVAPNASTRTFNLAGGPAHANQWVYVGIE